jgi:hypothetical protein
MNCGIYRHYKGKYYQVLGVAQHTETNELCVVYVALDGIDQAGPRMRVRPLHGSEGFLTRVGKGTLVSTQRFTYIGDSVTIAEPVSSVHGANMRGSASVRLPTIVECPACLERRLHSKQETTQYHPEAGTGQDNRTVRG